MLPFNPLVTRSLASNELINLDCSDLLECLPCSLVTNIPVPVTAFTVFPDGKLGAGFANGTIHLFNPEETEPYLTREAGIAVQTLAAIPPNPQLSSSVYSLASGCENGQIFIWSTELGGGEICTLAAAPADDIGGSISVTALAMLGVEKLASGYSDGTIRVWDLFKKTILHTITDAPPVKFLVAVGEFLVSASDVWKEGAVHKWYSYQPIMFTSSLNQVVGKESIRQVHAFAVLNNGDLAIAHGPERNYIDIWDSQSGTFKKRDVSPDKVAVLATFPDGRLASAFSSGRIRIFDTDSLERLHEINVGEDRVTCLTPLLDGKLAVGFVSGKIRTFPIVTQALFAQFTQLLQTNCSLVQLTHQEYLGPQLNKMITEKVVRNISAMGQKFIQLKRDLSGASIRAAAVEKQCAILVEKVARCKAALAQSSAAIVGTTPLSGAASTEPASTESSTDPVGDSWSVGTVTSWLSSAVAGVTSLSGTGGAASTDGPKS